jgi:hypothetical protein
MSKLPALRKTFLLVALGMSLILLTMPGARAQQGSGGSSAAQGGGYSGNAGNSPQRVRPIITMSDIWGPAKMPPAPKDFGPNFDFPPEPLNGTPLHDPYPN